MFYVVRKIIDRPIRKGREVLFNQIDLTSESEEFAKEKYEELKGYFKEDENFSHIALFSRSGNDTPCKLLMYHVKLENAEQDVFMRLHTYYMRFTREGTLIL